MPYQPAPVAWGVIPAVGRVLFGWMDASQLGWVRFPVTNRDRGQLGHAWNASTTFYHSTRKQGPDKGQPSHPSHSTTAFKRTPVRFPAEPQ